MTPEELKQLASAPADFVKTIQQHASGVERGEALKQFQPETHGVNDTTVRPNKKVNKPTGEKNADGSDQMTESVEKVARIPLSLQKRIVNASATFLTGVPVDLIAHPETDQEQQLYDMVWKTWQDNKLDYKTRHIAKAMMSEQECAEVWYMADAPEGYWGGLGNANTSKRLRFAILTPSGGNAFYPVFDKFGDMIAFGRGYELKEGDKKIQHMDVFTAEMKYAMVKGESDWQLDAENTQPNLFGKIPVIYYSQKRTEWQDVQPLIERLETLLSNFADTNDYFGSPMVVVSGEVQGFASKGESGKVLQTTEGAKVEYLTWQHAPEAIKLEIETLTEQIETLTNTPNSTFRQMKGLGDLSGIALKLMFMDAHGKAKDKQDGEYGECIQRRINLIKTGCVKINVTLEKSEGMSIYPKFGLFLPDNEMESVTLQGKKIDNLLRATGERPVLSQETAVQMNPLLENAEDELDLLAKQAKAENITIE